ncbi:Trehalose-6-P synthase/phosphatase complex synthase subunit [Asimina triloba]
MKPLILSLYEAAYFGTHDESILDEAIDFTTNQLNSVLPHLSSPLSELVKLALDLPLLKRIERLQSRYFISVYQQDKDRNDVLLEFAKLDFNILQSLHKKELTRTEMMYSLNLPILELTLMVVLELANVNIHIDAGFATH